MALVIPTIFTAVDRMSGPMGKMARGLAGLNTIAGASGAALTRSLNSISATSAEIASSAGMLGLGVAVPLGLATKAAIDFEKQMTNVATLVDTATESMKAMGDEVLQIASRTPVELHDLTESLYQIRSEGFAGAQAMDILEQSARLSVAGLSSATEATKAVASAIRVFGDEGLTTTQVTDLFFKTVALGRTKMDAINESFGSNAAIIHEAGVRFMELQAATAAMTNSGMTASEAQTALKGSVIALIKPSTEMDKVLRALNVTTGQQLIKNMGGLVPAMQAVGKTAKETGVNVNEAFGRVQGLTAYTLLTGSLSKQFEQDMKRMGNGVNEINEAYAKQLGTTAAQSQLAQNNIRILAIRVGELLLPALTSLLQKMIPIIQAVTRFAQRHQKLTGFIVKSAAGFAAFALTVSAIGFAVSTVTKAIWLWSGALKAVDFLMGFTSVVFGTATEAMLANTAATYGGQTALWLYNTAVIAVDRSMGVLAMTSATLLGRLVLIAGVVFAIQKAYESMFKTQVKAATDKATMIYEGLPEAQKEPFEKKYYTDGNHASMKSIYSLNKDEAKHFDSLSDKYYEPKRDSLEDISYKGGDTYNINGKDSSGVQKIELVLPAGFGAKTANSGSGVPISIKQTGSY